MPKVECAYLLEGVHSGISLVGASSQIYNLFEVSALRASLSISHRMRRPRQDHPAVPLKESSGDLEERNRPDQESR